MNIKFMGSTEKKDLERRIQNISAAGKLSRYPGNVFEVLESCNDYEKNLRMIKRIISMGHKSIIEHDYLVFALCDVTPIIEQTIIESRLTSFTIKSRREVDFRNVGFYTPTFRDKNGNINSKNEELQNVYKDYMKTLFCSYGDLVDKGVKVEDARFILPYSYHSNIIMGLDARELENMIKYLVNGKVSLISECRELGEKLYELCKEYVPYLVDLIDINLYTTEEKINKRQEIKDEIDKINIEVPKEEILDKPQLTSYTQNSDEVIIKSAIMNNFQCLEKKAIDIMNLGMQKDEKFKENMMKVILKQDAQRELEQVSFTFQIPISLSVLTHITRHRMHSLLVPDFAPMWDLRKYIIPTSMKNFEKEIKEIFENNATMCDSFRKNGVLEEDLVYFYLSGNMCNIVTTLNGRTLQWIARMRCCNKAQWQIRQIVKEMVKQVKEVSPLLGTKLGPTCETEGKCYEGKESCGKVNDIKK